MLQQPHILDNYGDFSKKLVYSLICLDIDTTIDMLRTGIESVHFTDISSMFTSYAMFLGTVAPFLGYYFKHDGLILRMSGKFGRSILVKSSTRQVSFGITSGGTATTGCIYRFTACRTMSGAFGLHLWIFTKNLVSPSLTQ